MLRTKFLEAFQTQKFSSFAFVNAPHVAESFSFLLFNNGIALAPDLKNQTEVTNEE
jgi:hypothetical protein